MALWLVAPALKANARQPEQPFHYRFSTRIGTEVGLPANTSRLSIQVS
jgi:hypothetical protein